MTKMKWERATQRDRDEGSVKQAYRQAQMRKFVRRHRLRCFGCGTASPITWAKTGRNRRGPWAICVGCVEAHTRSRRLDDEWRERAEG